MKKFFNIASALICFLFIVCFSVVFTLNFRPLYHWDVSSLNLAEKTGYNEELILENYDILIDYNYLFNNDPLEFNGLAMSESGKIHFEEVKEIFDGFQILFIIAAILAFASSIYLIKKKEYEFLKLTSIFTVSIPTILGILIGWNWNWFFVTFHEIAFDNDYWIFDPQYDEVIKILPDEFFMHCALMIIGISIICATSIFLIWKLKFKNITSL